MCPVCVHAQRALIETNAQGLSLRQLATAYGVSRSSLSRHRRGACRSQSVGLSAALAPPASCPVPCAVAHPAVHADAVQLATVLRDRRVSVDLRQAAAMLAALLVRLTADDNGTVR